MRSSKPSLSLTGEGNPLSCDILHDATNAAPRRIAA